MKISCKFGKGNTKIVEVSPDDPLYVLFEKLNITDKGTKFIFNGNFYSMDSIQTFQEIDMTDDDIIIINLLKIELMCKIGTKNIRIVEVSPDDPLNILLTKLNITDRTTKFIYKGIAYSLVSIQTFREIGVTCDTRITINNQPVAGGVEDKNRFTNLSKEFIR